MATMAALHVSLAPLTNIALALAPDTVTLLALPVAWPLCPV